MIGGRVGQIQDAAARLVAEFRGGVVRKKLRAAFDAGQVASVHLRFLMTVRIIGKIDPPLTTDEAVAAFDQARRTAG